MVKFKTKLQISAGGVIFKKENDKMLVAIVARDGKRIWCLPKGIVERGENPEETALREVREETGLEGKLIQKLDKIEYWYYWKAEQVRYHKFVYFYLLEFVGGSTEDHDFELEAVEWLPIDEAIEKLSYKSEKEVMKKAKEVLVSDI